MLLIPSTYNNKQKIPTDIPSFVYLTSSMHNTISKSNTDYTADDFDSAEEVRKIFTDMQLLSWLKEIQHVLPSTQYRNKLVTELNRIYKIEPIRQHLDPRKVSKHSASQLSSFFRYYKEVTVRNIKNNCMTGNVNGGHDKNRDIWSEQLFSTDVRQSLIYIIPARDVPAFTNVCPVEPNTRLLGLMQIHLLNGALTQVMGNSVMDNLHQLLDHEAIESFISAYQHEFY